MWTERLLVRLCQLVNQSAETGQYADAEKALQAYRFWAKFWETTGNGTSAEGMTRPRRSAWKAYYDTLSEILRHRLPYSPEPRSSGNNITNGQEKQHSIVKLHQRAELKRVETVYESLLLKETHFPKASEDSHEIEAWTDAVMENWRQLCGPTWSDEDLGEGGKEAVGRGVLDVGVPDGYRVNVLKLTLRRYSIAQQRRLSIPLNYYDTCSPCMRPLLNLTWHSKPMIRTWRLFLEARTEPRSLKRTWRSTMIA
jgi:hypothetical protein